MDNLQPLLNQACDSVRDQVGVGLPAQYIPALSSIDPHKFGAAVVTVDGEVYRYGDAEEPFSIQSIAKVFTLTLALQKVGSDLWTRINREPSGSRFNSIVQLEHECGIPRNPLINAGALVVTDVLLNGTHGDAGKQQLLQYARTLADSHGVSMDAEVAASERATAHRNESLAAFMKSFGNLHNPVDAVLDLYCHQCALAMNCEQLARSFLFLATQGVDPCSGDRITSSQRARRINSIMMLCGHYDASGDFAFRVGLPGKSGVGGGIVAVVPNRACVAVWSPCLNANGNSHAGTAALEAIAQAAGWSVL